MLKVTKANSIVNSSYRLSLNELRIVLYGLSKIDPTESEFPLFHTINIKELAEFYNIGYKERGSFYDNIKKALITKFWERDFSYFDEDEGAIVKRRWLIEVRYGGKNGTMSYHYNPMIKKELQNLANRFTSYFLKNIADMKSAYAVRIYEIALMHLNASKKNKVIFIEDIEKLKNSLGISDKYKVFFDFKKRILEKAREEINKYSDIKLSYEPIKVGRIPKEIKFTVMRKSSNQELLASNQELLDKVSKARIEKQKISTSTLDLAKKMALTAGTRWDIYAIEQQFYDYARKNDSPKNLDAAFIGFVKKKISAPA